MPRGKSSQDTETIEMALLGFEQKKLEIEDKIRQLRRMLGLGGPGRPPKKDALHVPASAAPATRKRRPLSAAARKRIALAQRRRWAEHRKNQAASGE